MNQQVDEDKNQKLPSKAVPISQGNDALGVQPSVTHLLPNMSQQPDLFPRILMTLLMDEHNHHIMRFVPEKDTHFQVINVHLFVMNILPYHFHLKMWGAFENKLGRYGFQQVSKRSLSKLEIHGYAEDVSPKKRKLQPNKRVTSDTGDNVGTKTPHPKEYDDTKMAILTKVLDDNLTKVEIEGKPDAPDIQLDSSSGFITFYHPLFKKGIWDTLDQIVPTVKSRRTRKR